jgi:hypothetical protein
MYQVVGTTVLFNSIDDKSGIVASNLLCTHSFFSCLYYPGGTRVVQFLTGGWINHNLPNKRLYKSNTNIFPNDIAPTLLDMVGANVSLLLDGKNGAPYGNPLWKYIKNSVDTTDRTKPKQMVRKVVISKELFFDVQANRTLKNFYNGNVPLSTPRLWDPIWPKNGDLLM